MYFEKKQQKVICSFATDLLKEWAQANLTEEVSESKENCLLSNRKRVSQDNSDYYMLYLGPVFLNFFFQTTEMRVGSFELYKDWQFQEPHKCSNMDIS